MKNLWPEQFSENQKVSAKQLFEEQSKLLPAVTGDLVYAEVIELDAIDAIRQDQQNDFVYSFEIRGKFLNGYRFRVLSFSHDITLYPVLIRIDGELGKELQLEEVYGYGRSTEIENPEEFEDFLSAVLKSKRIGKVIGSIMKLSA